MFERKNQSILSEHFTKLVDHAGDGAGSDSDDDFITLGLSCSGVLQDINGQYGTIDLCAQVPGVPSTGQDDTAAARGSGVTARGLR